jgi:hypothetical protein
MTAALRVISGREASMFACLTDVVVAPVAPLPPVAETDAAQSFDEQLALAPGLNRLGLRAALHLLELAPLAVGAGHRLRRLAPAARTMALADLDRNPVLAPLLKVMRSVAHLSYYGDLRVMALLGYDPERVVARARALRAAEDRW